MNLGALVPMTGPGNEKLPLLTGLPVQLVSTIVLQDSGSWMERGNRAVFLLRYSESVY
mgnify:CR=1 FL=1